MPESPEFQERIARIEGMVRKLESASDPSLRTTARELLQSLMELHAEGLGRIMDNIAGEGETGARILGQLARDPIVGSLLILYNLHPEDFAARLDRAFEKGRMLLRKQGATLSVLAAGEALVHVRIAGGTGQDLQSLVRDALLESVPDVAEIVIEGGQQAQSGFVPLETLLTNHHAAPLVGADSRP
jgi:hypothetical protein